MDLRDQGQRAAVKHQRRGLDVVEEGVQDAGFSRSSNQIGGLTQAPRSQQVWAWTVSGVITQPASAISGNPRWWHP
jgi:hypothetical protein